MLSSAEKFLTKYLRGRYEDTIKPEAAKRLGEIAVDVKNVTLKSQAKKTFVAFSSFDDML